MDQPDISSNMRNKSAPNTSSVAVGEGQLTVSVTPHTTFQRLAVSATEPSGQVSTERHVRGGLVARNSIFTFTGQILPLVVGIILMPYVIKGLGASRFGLLSLAWALLNYLGTFDLGLGRASIKFVADALGKNQWERVGPLVWTAAGVQLVFGTACGLALGLLAPIVVRACHVPPALEAEGVHALLLLALIVPLMQVSGSFQGALQAAQRFDLETLIRVPASVATYVLSAIGVHLHLSIAQIIALLLAARALFLAGFILLSMQLFPSLRRIRGDIGVARSIFAFGKWVTVSAVIVPVFVYLERFLIASMISLTALTYYSVPFEIVSRMIILPSSIAMVLFPTLSSHVGAQRSLDAELLLRPLKYLVSIMVPVCLVLIVFAREFLLLWLGPTFAQNSTTVFRISVAAVLFNALTFVPYATVQALGRPDLKAKLDLLLVPVFVLLCVALIPVFGINGGAIAKLLITIADCVVLTLLVIRLLGLRSMNPHGDWWFAALVGNVVLSAMLGAVWLLSIPIWSKAMLVCMGVAAYVAWGKKTLVDETDLSAFRSAGRYFCRLVGNER